MPQRMTAFALLMIEETGLEAAKDATHTTSGESSGYKGGLGTGKRFREI